MAELVKEGRAPEHSCGQELPGHARPEAVYQCSCGKYWQWSEFWSYDYDGYETGWQQVRDSLGTPLEKVPRGEYFQRVGRLAHHCAHCGARGLLWGHAHEIWR